MLEEAIELAQAEGIAITFVTTLAVHVYSKPPGDPYQEAGGVAVCLLAYCQAKDFDADDVEQAEIARVLGKVPHEFERRQREKAEAGIARKPEP